ncbi:MAG: exo-alpha-sialidase [Phycisphaerae bacterium]|nr:exo-alpha-sialidase [Phycisphaerae bacterium]
MAETAKRYPHETEAVGGTAADRARNAALLGGYEYERYVEALTGYTGQDLQRVGFVAWKPAVRVRVGDRGNYKAGMIQRKDGGLVAAVCRDNNDPDRAKRRFGIFVYESADRGESWREIGETPLYGKEPMLVGLPSGRLVMTAQGGVVGAGGERKPDEQTLAWSDDGGRSWTSSVYRSWDYPRQAVVEEDGGLLVVTAKKPEWGGEPNGSSHLQLGRSRDGGETWEFSEGRIDWDYTWFGEVGAVRLRDGRLLAALRRQLPETTGEGFEDTVITESTDGGRTWARPWSLTGNAHVHAYLTELRDGRLLCTYSNYHVPFGVSAIVSEDGGRTWDRDRTIRLHTSNGYWVGWAVTLELKGGELITSYAATTYREEAPRHVTCEAVRWRL